jgi:phosphoglycolate phosphatase
MLRDAGISPKRFERVCAARDAVPLYEDVLTVIRQLADEDIALGAVTNLPGWMAGPMLRCHELDEYFESAVTYERTTKRKPHPAPLLLCCQELDVAADEDTWYVGDSVGDYQAAQAAGLSFAWASWGYGSSAPLGSSMTLDGLNDLLAL